MAVVLLPILSGGDPVLFIHTSPLPYHHCLSPLTPTTFTCIKSLRSPAGKKRIMVHVFQPFDDLVCPGPPGRLPLGYKSSEVFLLTLHCNSRNIKRASYFPRPLVLIHMIRNALWDSRPNCYMWLHTLDATHHALRPHRTSPTKLPPVDRILTQKNRFIFLNTDHFPIMFPINSAV